jgi:hypothetical protein
LFFLGEFDKAIEQFERSATVWPPLAEVAAEAVAGVVAAAASAAAARADGKGGDERQR